jgi:hypothetical protein
MTTIRANPLHLSNLRSYQIMRERMTTIRVNPLHPLNLRSYPHGIRSICVPIRSISNFLRIFATIHYPILPI